MRLSGLRDVILHSIEANADHGVRRSIADRRRAITMVLQDPKWTAWSNSEIAQRCAVNDKTASRTYRDRHGNMSQMQTDRIGRRAEPGLNAPAESEAQGELLDEAPEASESGEPPPELALVIHLTDILGR